MVAPPRWLNPVGGLRPGAALAWGTVRRAALAGLAAWAADSLPAQAPAQVGGAFATLFFPSQGVLATTEYFGFDGTFDELSAAGAGEAPGGGSLYYPSSRGTYTYRRVPGSSRQANLTLTYPGGHVVTLPLDFADNADALTTFPLGVAVANFFPGTGEDQVLNVSNRARLRAGDAAITGFVIGGFLERPVLVRAVGPSLSGFGVAPVSPSPQFALFYGNGTTPFAAGAGWNGQNNTQLGGTAGPHPFDAQAMAWIFGLTGAFPLDPAADEPVFFGFLGPGTYTVQTTDPAATAAGGWELTEVYIFPHAGEQDVVLPAAR